MSNTFHCPLDFIVIGDSAAGLGCAIALACGGHCVTVLERRQQTHNDNGNDNSNDTDIDSDLRPLRDGIHLSPNVARIIHTFPGASVVFGKATKLEVLEFRTGNTDQVMGCMFFKSQMMEDLGSDYYLISHHDYTAFMHSFCHKLGVKFFYNFPIQTIETLRDGPAVAIGENGERIEGDVIIGADGRNSVVREYLLKQETADDDDSDDDDDTCASSTAGLMGLFKVVVGGSVSMPLESMRLYPELYELVTSKKCIVWMGDGYCLTGGVHGDVYTLGVTLTRQTTPNDLDLEWTTPCSSQFMHSYIPDAHIVLKILIDIAKVGHPTVQHIHPVESYVDPHSKAVIVGDAAHCTPIYGTHNFSLAIEDTFTLGQLFTHITHKSEIPSFLHGFNEIRIPRSKIVSNSELSGLMFTSLPPGEHRELRNFGLRYSLDIANAPNEHSEELAQMWTSWIALANYDALESVEEWWLNWGRHFSEMKVNNTE